MVDDGRLAGRKDRRQVRWVYRVSRVAVEAAAVSGGDTLQALKQQLAELTDRVAQLEARGYPAGPFAVAEERDHYRAENVALREVALRLNAAMEQMQGAFAEQREAVSQLLTPHSPQQ